jgi:two-component SAPR family response regulator
MSSAGEIPLNAAVLAEVRVLVIEDDYLVASECASMLRKHGATVLGPVPDVEQGRELMERAAPDCVLLDINLKGDFAFELADEFRRQRIPVIFTTGYESSMLPEHLREMPCLLKPVERQTLIRLIRREASAR